jgi:hypothetical protein
MKKLQLPILFLFYLVINAMGANSKGQKIVSIYQVGDSIVNYDTNFTNLFRNWTDKNITNASDYKLLNYTFLETIADSSTLEFYSRLMTSNKMIGLGSKYSAETTKNISEVKYAVEPTQFSFDSLYTVKNPRLKRLYEDISFFQEIKRLYSDEFSMREVKREKIAAYKSPDLLTDEEYKVFLLNSTKVERMMAQLYFIEFVNIGDVVYAVHFKYLDKLYTDYVVCDSKTKKVKLDGFFKGVHMYVDLK